MKKGYTRTKDLTGHPISGVKRKECILANHSCCSVKFFIWLACWRMFLLELYKEKVKEKRHLKNALYIRDEVSLVWLVLSWWIVEL